MGEMEREKHAERSAVRTTLQIITNADSPVPVEESGRAERGVCGVQGFRSSHRDGPRGPPRTRLEPPQQARTGPRGGPPLGGASPRPRPPSQ